VSRPRVALVTGGGAGIGAATCRWLAREGHAVGVLGRDARNTTAVTRSIEAASGNAIAVVADVADRGRVDRSSAARPAVWRASTNSPASWTAAASLATADGEAVQLRLPGRPPRFARPFAHPWGGEGILPSAGKGSGGG